ncbi:MAG: hypothetical protein K1X67_18480 [Fimbriimonadaceae bacterium]|nr:hypothetical protein [Fimbriimonadaceae bacterium]
MRAADLAAARLARTAFVVRAITAIVIHFFVTPGLFAPDEQTYDFRGELLAKYWRGEVPMDPTPGFQGETKGYYYIVAALYFPFGQFPLLPKLLNAWIGSRAVLELFRLTRLIGGSELAAIRAARFMAFFPSMVLWSSLMVRDVWVQWLLVRLAREMAELRGRIIPSRMLSATTLIWGLTLFRSYLLYAAVGPFVLSFFLGRSKDLVRNVFLGSLLALGLVYFGSQGGGTEGKIQTLDLVELQRLRSWSSSAVAADSGFASDADISTIGGAFGFLPTGLAYFFFAPFPWQIGSIRQSLAIPETLFFYTLVPGIVAGTLFLFRKRLSDSLGVLLVTMTVTFGYAIGQGNVGTLYRHKAQVIGFYYAVAAIGMEQRTRQRGAMLRAPYGPDPRHLARAGSVAAYAGPPSR